MSDKITREVERLNTIIGQGTVLKGECAVKGTVRVEGVIDGSLNASGIAILGKSGQVKGDMLVGNAIVGGKVDGSVVASGRLELQTGAKVEGDIKARKLVVEEGVFFQGYCNMKEVASERKGVVEPALEKAEAIGKDEKQKKVEEASDDDQEITFHGEPV